MGYPPTDYIGFTIKTKDRKVFKYRLVGMIFESESKASDWASWACEQYDNGKQGILTADERIALEGYEIISVQGNL